MSEIKDNNEYVDVSIYYNRLDGAYHFFKEDPRKLLPNKNRTWAFVKTIRVPIETIEINDAVIFGVSGEYKYFEGGNW